MEPATHFRTHRGRGNGAHDGISGPGRRTHHKNRQWVAEGSNNRSATNTPQPVSDGGEKRERGGPRGSRGRGRPPRGKFGNASTSFRRNGDLGDGSAAASEGEHSEMDDDTEVNGVEEPDLETPEDREKFWLEMVKAREVERKRAIAEGKMDDPLIPKRLEDAITMVGTCMDMCPRFERYRRERENNLFEWETVPGTKRVDHKRAVKMYERAAGDKTLPSDLRPPEVLQSTLDYLFHDLMPRGGFSPTFNFIRDRSRAVRNDFTMQHEMGPLAIECHDRCARFHILGLHLERDRPGFSIAMEEQQLMNTLQSLKEFYEDQRGRYQSPTELEMRVYHRLIHIRDQKERHEDIPSSISTHPVFELTTRFRARVQAKSAPISKNSPLVVDGQGMEIFAELAGVLREEGNVVMIYLVACILERLFGTETIEDIESIRGQISLSDIIDGYSGDAHSEQMHSPDVEPEDLGVADELEEGKGMPSALGSQPARGPQRSATLWLNETYGAKPTQSTIFNTPSQPSPFSEPPPAAPQSAFSTLTAVPNAFGTTSVFGPSAFKPQIPSPAPITNSGPDSASGSSNGVISSFGSSQTTIPNIFGGVSAPTASIAASPFAGAGLAAFSPPPASTRSFTPTTAPLPSASRSPPGVSATNGVESPSGTDFVSQTHSLNPRAPSFTPLTTPASPEVTGGPTRLIQPQSSPFANGHTSESSSKRPRLLPDVLGQLPSTPVFPSPVKPTQPPTARAEDTPSQAATLPSVPMSNTSFPPSTGFDSPSNAMSPTQPPPLSRHQPISLPSTPTATIFIPSADNTNPKPLKSIFGTLGSLQTSSLSAQPTEILSPLVLSSPGPSRSMSSISFLRNESSQSPLRSVTAADVPSDKLHSPLNVSSDIIGKDELQRKALAFSRKGVLVKDIFDRWRERTAARIKWIEACRRSDSYSQKVQTQRRLPSNTGNITPERKRKTGPVDTRTPVRKRLKNRLSTEYKPPRNDEELAKRFEQNHEEHERRWARGSFLRALKDHLATLGGHSRPSNWSAWLSLNQENDGTAIWLEQKWDIPNSGKWRNDNIFEIPILEIHENSGVFPGIIIFERTPLSGVDDQLERKYRILDDCARLREIIDALPRSRHYLPSLLTVSWIKGGSDTTADFSDMVDTFLQDGTLNAHQEFLLTSTTTDLDIKVSEILQHLSLDVEGTLVQQMTFGALFKTIEPQLNFAVRWLDSCVINGEFDWYCHAKLLELTVAFLNGGIHTLFNLLDDPQPSDCLPPLDLQSATDSKVTFQLVLDWLQHPSICKATRGLVNDVQSHQILGREFPSRSFIPHLYNVVEDLAGLSMKRDGAALFCIQKSRFQEFSVQVAEMSSAVQDELKALHASRVRRSPKRRSSFGTSVSSRSSTPAKRRRLSVSNGSPPSREGSPAPSTAVPNHPSPSLSATTSLPSEDKFTLVTPAMLRALTKDVKAKYGSPLAAGSS